MLYKSKSSIIYNGNTAVQDLITSYELWYLIYWKENLFYPQRGFISSMSRASYDSQ